MLIFIAIVAPQLEVENFYGCFIANYELTGKQSCKTVSHFYTASSELYVSLAALPISHVTAMMGNDWKVLRRI